MSRRFDGKVAIVTGSGKGIGRATATLLAAEGARVVVNDIGRDADNAALAEQVAAEIASAGGQAVASQDSVSTFEGCHSVVNTAIEAFGRLDILINNAGLRAMDRIDLLTEQDFDMVVSSHLKHSFAMIKYAIPHFLEQGSGVILNTGSEAGLGSAYNSLYSAAKEGIAGLTRAVAREFALEGIRCNLVRPRAATVREALDEPMQRWADQLAKLGRYAFGDRAGTENHSAPEDVAVLNAWLCSDAAADLNGYDFYVSGEDIGLWSEPELVRQVHNVGGWTLDELDKIAPSSLTFGLTNRFAGAAG